MVNLLQASSTPSDENTSVSPRDREIGLRDVLISLNNSSIELLQHGSWRASIDTFKDAITLMKSDSDASSFSCALFNAEQRRLQNVGRTDNFTCSPSLVVLSSQHDAQDAYSLLARVRTSKVCLTLDVNDATVDLELLHSVLVFNFGIAHRCCSEGAATKALEAFALQVFQYAEKLLPPSSTNLLFKLVLTRNLMMLSCRLGMSLCEHYKETLDPIISDILGPHESETATRQGTPAA